MPKYMFQARYTAEGAKGVLAAGGSARRAAIKKAAAAAGGKLESFYFGFGGVDAYTVCDLPDDTTAAAMAMAVGASGSSSVCTVKLLTPEDIDKAAKMKISYKPPGR